MLSLLVSGTSDVNAKLTVLSCSGLPLELLKLSFVKEVVELSALAEFKVSSELVESVAKGTKNTFSWL